MKKLFLLIPVFALLANANAQNVGIGTTNPVAKLHVDATADFIAKFNSSSPYSFIIFSENNVDRGYIGSSSGAPEDFDIGTTGPFSSRLHLTTNGNPRLTVANNGNIGIGTMSPVYKLDVAGRLRLQQTSATAGIYFDGITLPTRSFIGTLNDDHVGIYGSGGAGWNFVMNVENGNIGIGTISPQFPLNFSNTLGDKISFWNSGGTTSYGIGLQNFLLQIHASTSSDDIAFGYGSSATLTETMRIKGNGNVGIGTSAPTAKLDVNGALRIRGGSPAPGSVLTSVDSNGNAVWKENNVAFKAYGMNSGYNSFPPTTTFNRVHFGGERFDLGNDYELLPPNTTASANSSTFTVPVSGIYQFNLNIEVETSDVTEPVFAGTVKLKLNRNGVVSDLAIADATSTVAGAIENMASMSFSTNELLNANDKVYIEIMVTTLANSSSISYGPATWFSGYLVKAL